MRVGHACCHRHLQHQATDLIFWEIIKRKKNMLKATYILLAIAAAGVLAWQFGSLLGIPGAPAKPGMTVTVSALTAAIIFFGLWCAGWASPQKLEVNVLPE